MLLDIFFLDASLRWAIRLTRLCELREEVVVGELHLVLLIHDHRPVLAPLFFSACPIEVKLLLYFTLCLLN